MGGADTILSLIWLVLGVLVVAVVGGVFVQLAGPIHNQVVGDQLMTDLGWGVPQEVVILFTAVAMIGLGLVLIWWWITKPVREDVRQEQTRGGF